MRGYFAIGVERISKPMNVGNLVRSAHAFGANFFFTVDAYHTVLDAKSDTSKAPGHLPVYHWQSVDQMALPEKCALVGVELLDGAVDLPSFRHPLQAAYVLGPERGSLSPRMVEKCAFTIKIPTSFCINVAMAGAKTARPITPHRHISFKLNRNMAAAPSRIGMGPLLSGPFLDDG